MPLRIDEKVMVGPQDTRRDVREDEIVPGEKMRDEPIGRGKCDPFAPIQLR